MSKTYFTLTGTKYYFGKEFLKPGMKVQLIKEPENELIRKDLCRSIFDYKKEGGTKDGID